VIVAYWKGEMEWKGRVEN